MRVIPLCAGLMLVVALSFRPPGAAASAGPQGFSHDFMQQLSVKAQAELLRYQRRCRQVKTRAECMRKKRLTVPLKDGTRLDIHIYRGHVIGAIRTF